MGNDAIQQVGGSFRDPSNRVFTIRNKAGEVTRVLRGLKDPELSQLVALLELPFFLRLVQENRVVNTNLLDEADPAAIDLLNKGWQATVEHQVVPFISYPYEWSFAMLRTAALLHLRILEDAMREGWTLKDATPFNIQFAGCKPVFIDIPSFAPLQEGEGWTAYRQFCSTFLTPLMMRAYLGVDHLPLMRSYIDGMPPTEAVKYFSGTSRLRRGVLSHIVFPAAVENRIASKERDDADAQIRSSRPQSRQTVLALVESMTRLVRSLKLKLDHTDWSDYDQTHSYNSDEHEAKKAFVGSAISGLETPLVWDIGCNTGTFSRIASPLSKQVISLDGDHNAIEKLYKVESAADESNILPLVMNLANISPSQGWAGIERIAFDERGKPDIALLLALVHHLRLSANIPLDMLFDWLAKLQTQVVIEFVDRHDEMVVKLLTNKAEKYEDYNRDNFIAQAKRHFTIANSKLLKDGKREIFHLIPS